MLETHPFGNFVPKKMNYLLLGSFTARSVNTDPGYDWYYSSKRNQFWPILELVYNKPLSFKFERQKLFNDLGMGLGDVIYQCERRNNNSLDNNLINIVYNPELPEIVAKYKPTKIFFTSAFVAMQYKRAFRNLVAEFTTIELITLPSPSPRYAKLSKDAKAVIYRELLPRLNTK